MVRRSASSKFPIARIKRIMQADEDVGKVAQATPVVISKALELFMQDIVESAVEQTRKTGGKRVAPYHLYVCTTDCRKRAALNTETFDFLRDILEKVADPLELSTPARQPKRRKMTKQALDEGASEAGREQDAHCEVAEQKQEPELAEVSPKEEHDVDSEHVVPKDENEQAGEARVLQPEPTEGTAHGEQVPLKQEELTEPVSTKPLTADAPDDDYDAPDDGQPAHTSRYDPVHDASS